MKKIVDKFNTDSNFEKGQEVSKLTSKNSGIFLEESDGESLLAQVINSKSIPTPTEESVSSSPLVSQHVERKSIEEMIKDRFIDGNLDGINYEWFNKASKELRGGTYQFKNPNEESW